MFSGVKGSLTTSQKRMFVAQSRTENKCLWLTQNR
jgi:hypothetical protein